MNVALASEAFQASLEHLRAARDADVDESFVAGLREDLERARTALQAAWAAAQAEKIDAEWAAA